MRGEAGIYLQNLEVDFTHSYSFSKYIFYIDVYYFEKAGCFDN